MKLNRCFSSTRRPHTKVLYFLFIMILLAVLLGAPLAQPIRARELVYKPDSSSTASEIGWNALPNGGLNSRVRALALAGDSLYAGGKFTQTFDGLVTGLGHVTRYDIADRTWNALPNQGLNAEVTALAMVETNLYAGGGFTQTVDAAVMDLGNIARYDSVAETWNALPHQGLNGNIFALGAVDTDLYAGGLFTQSGNGTVTNLNHIARFDTLAGTWHALPHQGLNGSVYVLATTGSDVYAGGGFSQTGDGAVTNLNHIARYNSTAGSWHALSNQGLDGSINALLVSGSDVYVGGYFTQTGDGALTNLNNIARYNTVSNTWHALPNQGLNDGVFTFALLGDDLYVGGAFDQTADGSLTTLGNIARYDTVSETWHALPNQGLVSWVYALIPVDSDLYAGGEFNQAGDGMVPGLGRIARWGEVDIKVYLPLVIR